MNLEKILAISGKPGLYALKVQTRSGFVAESFLDGKKITVGMKSNVSLLSEISVYSYDAEKQLSEVMKSIAEKEKNGPAISHKEDNDKLSAYFREVFSDYDESRVYPSDIKKILNWYNSLQAKGLINQEEPKIDPSDSEQVKQNTEEIQKEVVAEVKVPAKKAKAKKE
jgi:Domain of unknown function (DUF5606)